MIGKEKFVKMIVKKDSGINKQDAEDLYWSIAKTVAFYVLGKKQTEGARAEEDKLQQKFVSKINFATLDNIRLSFERIKEKEKRIREDPAAKKYPAYVVQRFVLESRVEIFSEILKFSPGDEKLVEEEITRMKRDRRNKNILKFGLGAAGVAALGLAIHHIFKSSIKKTEKNKSPVV